MTGTETTAERWTMPDWMEPYRELINNTGGNEVEDLINRLATETHLASTNIVVFTIAVAVQSQVRLLAILHQEGLLLTPRGEVSS